jgi:glutamate racemase
MKPKTALSALLALLSLLAAAPALLPAAPPDLSAFFAKKDVTIAVTDSGFGGLSIMAEAAARMKTAGLFRSVKLVFFNALFDADSGYNSLFDRNKKIAVFNRALEALESRVHPDVILVGCNTLSVLTAETPFAKQTKTPVLDIVEAGVDLIARGLAGDPRTVALIFGTETTIGEGEHARRLAALGFAPRRIVAQACPELASFIESGPGSDEVALLIESFVDDALARVPDKTVPILASLNCTHYGYALPLWNKTFQARGLRSFVILNPNGRMLEPLFPAKAAKRFASTSVLASVVSMVPIDKTKIAALGGWLRNVSPEVAGALAHYELVPDLFAWKDLVK